MAVCSKEVIANLTGGTTALQWAVEEAARRVERLGVRVRRVAVVDRRSRAQQSEEPYVIGELLPLDRNGA